MPVGVFFLSAEVYNPDADMIQPFISRHSRNRHDRLDMHYGTFNATLVDTTDDDGNPTEITLEDALRTLMETVVFLESINGGRLLLDAWIHEFVWFWRDNFSRTVYIGYELGTSSGESGFGPFDWQRYDAYDPDATMGVDVDGTEMAMFAIGEAPNNLAEFVGYPTFTSGELWASIYTFHVDTAEWLVSWRPWRDDVADLDVWFHRHQIDGVWYMSAGIGSVISTDILTDVSAEDFNVAFLLGAPGDEIAVKLWNWEDDEPADWSATGTMPAPTSNITPVFHIEQIANATYHVFLNNLRTIKTDSDPVRLYHMFRLDAEVA